MARDHNREFTRLIEESGITQRTAAEILLKQSREAATKQSVQSMERRVRGWIAGKDTETKTRCPGWAVVLLELGLKERAQ